MNNINRMSIFFARSFVDFGSEYEKYWKEKIYDKYEGCSIIELPKDKIPNIPMYGVVLFEWEKEFLFPLVDSCDIIFTIPSENVKYMKYKGKFSQGVVLEIAYGLLTGKKVIGLINGEIRDVTLEDLEDYKKNKNIRSSLDMLCESVIC